MPLHGTVKAIVRSTDGAAMSTSGYFYGITISGAAGEVVVEDNTAVAGTNIIMQANGLGNYMLPAPIPVIRGIAINLTANIVTTYFQPGPLSA